MQNLTVDESADSDKNHPSMVKTSGFWMHQVVMLLFKERLNEEVRPEKAVKWGLSEKWERWSRRLPLASDPSHWPHMSVRQWKGSCENVSSSFWKPWVIWIKTNKSFEKTKFNWEICCTSHCQYTKCSKKQEETRSDRSQLKQDNWPRLTKMFFMEIEKKAIQGTIWKTLANFLV